MFWAILEEACSKTWTYGIDTGGNSTTPEFRKLRLWPPEVAYSLQSLEDEGVSGISEDPMAWYDSSSAEHVGGQMLVMGANL